MTRAERRALEHVLRFVPPSAAFVIGLALESLAAGHKAAAGFWLNRCESILAGLEETANGTS